MAKKKNEIEANAIEIVKGLVTKRNWYEGKFERQWANKYKKSAIAGTLSYEMAVKILTTLSYEKVKEEVWKFIII